MDTQRQSLGDDRSGSVLRAAVEHYIVSGEPVGSRALNKSALPFSSAMIRAIMARLEASGHLSHPHTSAGRVPTDQGYRAYVDALMAPNPLSEEQRRHLADLVGSATTERRQRTNASAAIAAATGLTGFALSAPGVDEVHRHMEFVRLRRGEVLGIVATREGAVYHRVVSVEEDISQSELERFQNYLNERFEGMTLREIRATIAEELERAKASYTSLCSRAMTLSSQALPPEAEREVDVVVGGHHNLLQLPEFSVGTRAAPVLEELERRQTWLSLLDATLRDVAVRLFIGQENAVDGFRSCTVVAAPVRWMDGAGGTIGLVGPTRLPYRAVIALIEGLRRQLFRDREAA